MQLAAPTMLVVSPVQLRNALLTGPVTSFVHLAWQMQQLLRILHMTWQHLPEEQ